MKRDNSHWPDGGNYLTPIEFEGKRYLIPPARYYEDSHTCWKCRQPYPNHFLRSGECGLCHRCWGELKNLSLFFGFLLMWGIAYVIQTRLMRYSAGGFIIDAVISLVAGAMLIALLLAVGYLLVMSIIVMWSLGLWGWGWIKAFAKLAQDAHSIYKHKLHEDAVKRAELANPQKLDGQALDALLTEQHKEKMGWK